MGEIQEQQVQQKLNQEEHTSFQKSFKMFCQAEDKSEEEREEFVPWELQELHSSSDNSTRKLDKEDIIEKGKENYVEEDEESEKDLEDMSSNKELEDTSSYTSETPDIEYTDSNQEEEENQIEEDGQKVYEKQDHVCALIHKNHMPIDISETDGEEKK